MVYNGPSKGCKACRKRRVKCDQGKPKCNNCTKRKVECPGYESTFDYRHRNETNSTILRVQQKGDTPGTQSPKSDVADTFVIGTKSGRISLDTIGPLSLSCDTDAVVTVTGDESPTNNKFDISTPFGVLPPDPEAVALNWYFANYPMKCVDPQSSRGFVSLLKPLYLSSAVDSPLRPAVAAVATNMLMLFCHQGPDTDMARKFYAQSVMRMNRKIADPLKSKDDDLVLTTMALNFYDMLNMRWDPDPTNYSNHRKGTVALIKHRGLSNRNTDISRQITAAVRTAVCHWGLEKGITVSPEMMEWMLDSSVPTNKAAELDMPTLRLINYQTRFSALYRKYKREILEADLQVVQAMISEGWEIDSQFVDWFDTNPSHWRPLYMSRDEAPPSLTRAGFWGDKCAVYWDMSICDTANVYRIRRLTLLRMLRQLLLDSFTTQSQEMLSSVDETMQRLATEQCEVVPFMIGDCVTTMRYGRLYEITYPSASTDTCTYPNPDHDHPRAAAASGGWLVSSMLVSLVKMAVKDGYLDPFPLPQDQLDWVTAQLGRLATVFLKSQPKRTSDWKVFRRT